MTIFKFVVYLPTEGATTIRCHRQERTLKEASNNLSLKLRGMAEKIVLEEWRKGQLVKRWDVTNSMKQAVTA